MASIFAAMSSVGSLFATISKEVNDEFTRNLYKRVGSIIHKGDCGCGIVCVIDIISLMLLDGSATVLIISKDKVKWKRHSHRHHKEKAKELYKRAGSIIDNGDCGCGIIGVIDIISLMRKKVDKHVEKTGCFDGKKLQNRKIQSHGGSGTFPAGCAQEPTPGVEQVIKEQNMLEMFDLLEGYCSLMLERVNLIEQEKHCPEELHEAVSSLKYADTRCGEFPELQEIHSILTLRFGREFVANAVERHNNCGVIRYIKAIG
ncbi:hypothetical protein CASFOL_037078 [Castilleja foliolosa]|uniref:Uncharacterized protein n=1 Tax=Castilleja foliolosa TaxID=1961234 RepID=A0ABD3BPW6_9LAMI